MKNNILLPSIGALFLYLGIINTGFSMGLRSFVALPVEKKGAVVRLAFVHAKKSDTDHLIASMAYGLSANQTLLLRLPYRISPAGGNRQGDLSALYRPIVWQQDNLSGMDRLGLLGGLVVPTEYNRDSAIQAGFVFTHFKMRNEIDLDVLYQSGIGRRANSGRYDLSWQYRLSPSERPDWGIPTQLNSVLELNSRWIEGNKMTHQVTAGLQWVQQKVVIEGGMVKDINKAKETRYILSTRFHF
ncbi:MAG: hypothetical protein R8K48_07970 [Gallionella sp.]